LTDIGLIERKINKGVKELKKQLRQVKVGGLKFYITEQTFKNTTIKTSSLDSLTLRGE
jgi:hypothetical protein